MSESSENEKFTSLTIKRWIVPFLLFPVNILVIIPAVILWLTDYHWEVNHPLFLLLGGMLLFFGLGLSAWTVRLFNSVGCGTAAPWDPPLHLVVAGPYCYVRNPMLTSVFIMQVAEALLFNSWAIFIFLIVFIIIFLFYLLFVEEKKLELRFGDAYQEYRRNVPRFIPRLRPWFEQ